MSKISVLQLGIKYWPYDDEIINDLSLKGFRGGGMNKYCNLLINSLPNDVKTIIICQRIRQQKRFEVIQGVYVYRTRTFGNRAIRQITANLLSFFVAFRIIRKENVDIIHGHLLPGIFISYLLGKLFKKPVVGTPYSFFTGGLNFIYLKLCKIIELKYFKKVDVLVFESNENRDRANTLRGLSFPNSIVIHTGIPVPSSTKRLKKNRAYNLLYIGRLKKIKALDNLVLSFLYLSEDTLNKVHLNIVGEGELYHQLNDLIVKNNLSSFITLHGFVDDSSKMFINNDIFILPSHQEGLSISLLEAMSYGMASIINNFGVPFPKNTVYEMPNNNPQSIANAITEIIQNAELYSSLCENARNEIIKNFSVEKFAFDYYNIYKGLTKQ